MSITGLCTICEAAEAKHRCERCGALVCDEHYDDALDLCTDCAGEVRAGRDGDREPERDPGERGDRPTDSIPDDDDTYRM